LSKKEQVADMFDSIAFRYDIMNRMLSAGTDMGWRKKAISQLKELQPKNILDVATGTGDVAMLTYQLLQPQKITGIDISNGMLDIGRKKIEKANLREYISLLQADSEHIPFPDASFDAVTVAFGVRNFEHLEEGLKEMLRVLRPGGKLVVLEFSKPKQTWFKRIASIYIDNIAPRFGKLFAKNKDAYQYLNDSIQAFPEGQAFLNIMNDAGFERTYLKPLSLGICTIYCGSRL
jgi:demethylmenaquinone methyltransferase/2-methoxy-6-polyprenyl-1,4-benzoquinol methylase